MTTTTNQTTDIALTIVQGGEFTDGDMTVQEAEAHVDRILRTADTMRWLLLEAFERKAYKALKYSNFEDFVNERLRLPFASDSLSRMVKWARIERNVLHITDKEKAEGKPRPKLTWAVAEQLSRLDDPEQQRIAFEEIEGLKEHGARTPGEYIKGLKHIVGRMAPSPDTGNKKQARSAASNASEQAASERKPDTNSRQNAPSASKPSVASFSPPADAPFDEEPAVSVREEFDLDAIRDAFGTVIRWLEAGRVLGNRKEALLVSARIREGARWIEQQVC